MSITIVCTTYFPPGPDGRQRADDASDAAHSWSEHLTIEGEILLHVADDGSDGENYQRFVDLMEYDRPAGSQFSTKPFSESRQERHGVGASLNAGMRVAFERGDLVLYAVDDWKMDGPLDLTPWARLLERDEMIACVRLGIAHPGLTGTVEHDPESGQYYLRLDRHHFAFGHRPALYHRRMVEAYGWFDEDVNAYECERLYNERFCANPGPDVVLALTHHWRHASDVELADIDPRGA